MDTAREKIVVRAGLGECYQVVTDFLRYPEWASDVKEVVIEEADSLGRALVVTFRAGAFGRSTAYTLSYVYDKTPRELSWVQLHGDISSKLDGRYIFTSASESETEVTYELSAELVVPIPGFIKRRAETKIIHSALADLRDRVESQIAKSQ